MTRNARSVDYETRKTVEKRFRMKVRLEAARKQMETATEKYRGALAAILIDAARLVSKDPRFKDRKVEARCVNYRFWVAVVGADEAVTREVASHPAVKEVREIFLQAELDWGSVVIPQRVVAVVSNGTIIEEDRKVVK